MPVNYSDELRLSYLRAAANAIEEEEATLQTYRDFYEGNQGVKLTDRQKEYLTKELTSFGNICKRAVSIAADRLNIPEDGITPIDEQSQGYADEARRWWSDATEPDEGGDNDAYALQPEIYTAALRDKAVAVIVGWNEALQKPTFTPNLLYDGADGLIRLHYDSDNNLIFASKRWTVWNPLKAGETGKRRLTIYTDGYIERFEAAKSTAGGWRQLSPAELGIPNPQPWTENGALAGKPLGNPVIPFENTCGSELDDVVNIQEVLNHNFSVFDRSIDMHGFPLLHIATDDMQDDDTITYGPHEAITTEAGGSVKRVQPGDLAQLFESGVMSWVQVIALVKGWPMWLFDRSQQAPSGVALQTMEQSLVAQVKQKQVTLSGAWRKAFNLARKLYRLKGGGDLPGQIKFEWADPATVDTLAQYEAKAKEFEAGQYPIVSRWRLMGKSEEEIAQMLADKQREDDLGLADTTTGITQ